MVPLAEFPLIGTLGMAFALSAFVELSLIFLPEHSTDSTVYPNFDASIVTQCGILFIFLKIRKLAAPVPEEKWRYILSAT